ncbi:hypothetical protein, partial [Rhizobium leguminosarum]|uniref:hypothetical protein n=1 Tax=Rhizobium leguminosarum TaxID=384 RepID=UPI00197FE846
LAFDSSSQSSLRPGWLGTNLKGSKAMTYALVLFSAVTAIVVSISAIGTAPAPNSKWPEIHSEKTSRLAPMHRS